MIPTISQVCTLHASTERDIEDFAAGHCESVEAWLTKVEQYLESHSIQDLQQVLEANQVRLTAASYQGGLFVPSGPMHQEAWSLFSRRLALCRELNIPVLVVACDVPGPLRRDDLERVQRSLSEAAKQAEEAGVRLAIEFQARAGIGNNLQTMAALVEQVGSRHLGICLDVFHFFIGPSKLSDLGYLTAENLLHVQVCDLADTPRELASDSDRILPGDGDFDLETVVRYLETIEYRGCVSLELMNPRLWQVPPLQMGEIGITAVRKLLGQAEI